MMTVDEILAAGWYTDRRGREWRYDTKHRFWLATPDFIAGWKVTDFGGPIDDAQMRLLIERDQHRDVCVGLHWCDSHPVPRVHFNIHTGAPIVIAGDEYIFADGGFSSHAEAMNAARALAVGE